MESKKGKSGKMKWVGTAVAAAALGTAAAGALSDKKTRNKVKNKTGEWFELAKEKAQQFVDEVATVKDEVQDKVAEKSKVVRKSIGKKASKAK